VEPATVKVYGLAAKTRRRYLIESALGLGLAAVLFLAWWLGWPWLRQRLQQPELPGAARIIRAVLEQAPWILLGAVLLKGVEMVVVLRCFARLPGKAPGSLARPGDNQAASLP